MSRRFAEITVTDAWSASRKPDADPPVRCRLVANADVRERPAAHRRERNAPVRSSRDLHRRESPGRTARRGGDSTRSRRGRSRRSRCQIYRQNRLRPPRRHRVAVCGRCALCDGQTPGMRRSARTSCSVSVISSPGMSGGHASADSTSRRHAVWRLSATRRSTAAVHAGFWRCVMEPCPLDECAHHLL